MTWLEFTNYHSLFIHPPPCSTIYLNELQPSSALLGIQGRTFWSQGTVIAQNVSFLQLSVGVSFSHWDLLGGPKVTAIL